MRSVTVSEKVPEAVYNMRSSWQQCNTHVYQVSSPCTLPLASLRSEEACAKFSVRKVFICPENALRDLEVRASTNQIARFKLPSSKLCIQTFVHIALTNCELH